MLNVVSSGRRFWKLTSVLLGGSCSKSGAGSGGAGARHPATAMTASANAIGRCHDGDRELIRVAGGSALARAMVRSPLYTSPAITISAIRSLEASMPLHSVQRPWSFVLFVVAIAGCASGG